MTGSYSTVASRLPPLIAVLLAGCASSQVQPGGTNTNWPVRCDSDAPCGSGSCECGICTRTCDGDAVCGEVADSRCMNASEIAACGSVERRVCAHVCEEDDDCGHLPGGHCEAGACLVEMQPADDGRVPSPPGADLGATGCDPLINRSQTVTLQDILVAARSADATLYVVDRRAEDDRYAVFSSEGARLVRRRVLGSSETEGLLLLTLDVHGTERTLAIETSEDGRVAVAEGERERGFEDVSTNGEILERVPTSDAQDYRLVDYGEMVIEYVAEDPQHASALVVVRPESDWSYEDFELYYGADRMLQTRTVGSVLRQQDGGSTDIEFEVDGEVWNAAFPFDGDPSLTTSEGEFPLLPRMAEAAHSFLYLCPGEPTASTSQPPPPRAQLSLLPPGNYGEACEPDMDTCDEEYECLEAPDGTSPGCWARCETVADCPRILSHHCGDQTTCEGGICGYWPCN